MKEIEYYIESNTKLMQEKQEEYNKLIQEKPYDDMELARLREWINGYKGYIQGLEDAKKYIEKEGK